MNIYHYRPNTNEYVGSSVADVDPMDSSNYLIPANATTVECTLEDREGFTKNFNEEDEVWEYHEIPSVPEKTWDEKRMRGYPSWREQMDDLFHQGAFSESMTATIQAVKDAHPKPE